MRQTTEAPDVFPVLPSFARPAEVGQTNVAGPRPRLTTPAAQAFSPAWWVPAGSVLGTCLSVGLILLATAYAVREAMSLLLTYDELELLRTVCGL